MFAAFALSLLLPPPEPTVAFEKNLSDAFRKSAAEKKPMVLCFTNSSPLVAAQRKLLEGGALARSAIRPWSCSPTWTTTTGSRTPRRRPRNWASSSSRVSSC